MIRYLIKNNFKLMFRNTWSIVVMILGPILIIAILSSAFSDLMKSYEGVDEFAVGYRIQEVDNSIMDNIKLAGEEVGILFHEYPQGEIKDVMEKNELASFVELSKEEYIVYTSEDYKIEGITFEYFMNKVMNANINEALQLQQSEIELPIEQLDYMPAVDSMDYYGIIYIVYFSWCGIICATGVLSNEKKYGIVRRFQVSNVSESRNFLGKLIPIVLTISVGMGIATVITTLLYNIHWGNLLLSSIIMLSMIVAGAAMGLMFYSISDNLVITIILQFVVVWFLGFFGGSFETYMFSSISDTLKHISPIYHGNRALVELSCMGKSSYVTSAIIYSMGITAVCSVIAILAGHIRKRGKVCSR